MINQKKQIDANTYEVEFSVPAAELKAETNKVYRREVSKYNIPGFRKGKAPLHVIERMYGSVFTQQAVENLYQKHIDAVVEEFGGDVVDVNSAEVVSIESDLVLKVKIVVKPTVKIEGYKGLTTEKVEAVVTDDDVEHELGHIQQRNSRSINVNDRPAQMDDIVVFDYKGFCDGVPFEGGEAESFSLKLGSGQFIPGFEEGVVGHSVDEAFDVNVTFPEEYHAEELAGKPAVFQCKIHEIKYTELPELNDEFAKDVSEFDTLAEYKESIRADLLRQAEERAKDEADNKLIDQLIDLVEADIPEAMYDVKVDENIRDFSYRLQNQGLSLEKYFEYTGLDMEGLRGQFRDQAIHQVKLRLALETIAELEGIEATEEDCEKEYQELAANYGMEVEKVKEIVPVDGLKKDIAVEKAVDVVRDSANYVTVPAQTEAEAE